jgi:hypothetical protein
VNTYLASSIALNASPLEELTPGITFQWLFDGKVAAFCAKNATRPVVDAWIGKLMEISDRWDPSKTLYTLNDYSAKDCVMTSYNQQRIRELSGKYPHLNNYSVTIVQQNLTMVIAKMLVRTMPNRDRVQLVFKYDDAIHWLKSTMAANGEALPVESSTI